MKGVSRILAANEPVRTGNSVIFQVKCKTTLLRKVEIVHVMTSGTAAGGVIFGVIPILIFLAYVGLFGLGVYLLILLIQLAKRGIMLLDMQIAEKQRAKRAELTDGNNNSFN